MINDITLIGVGLIGGSFVLDLKKQGLVSHVHGIDIDQDNLERAIERHVIDSQETKITDRIRETDLILIATPIRQFKNIILELKPFIQEKTIITEVGSTKLDILNLFKNNAPEFYHQYVATHPIAGSDRSGALAAQFGLFKNKKIIICPHEGQDTSSVNTVKQLWQAVGGQIEELSASKHDEIFAMVSHLPHLLAFTYINQILQQPDHEACFHFAGTGFRDFTRIASSDPSVWTDISIENEILLSKLIQQMQNELGQLNELLQQKNAEKLYQYFSTAKQRRDKWLKEENLD